MRLIFLGDIVTGGVLPYMDSSPISVEFAQFLNGFDLRIATLETAIGDNLAFDKKKMEGRGNIIYSPIQSAKLLSEMGINVVSLANNHLFDLGADGLRVTTQYLQEHNIAFTGAGNNLEEACKPVIIERDSIKIAIIAACTSDVSQVAYVPIATETEYGVAPLDEERICQQIVSYKRLCDYVIVMPHWGKEYTHFPLKKSVDLARKMVKHGADLVVGSHTHMIQPVVKISGKKVYFSLGNGLFPDFYVNSPRPIWYPDENTIDMTSIPVTYDYPFPVKSPLRRNWKDSSRYGVAVEATIKKTSISSSGRLIFLTRNNIAVLMRKKFPDFRLSLIGSFALSSYYDEGRFLSLIKKAALRFCKVIGIK